MELGQEQRTVIKFLVSTGATPIQCWRHLREGFNAETVSQKTVRKWHHRFSEGETSVKDRPRPGRPISARTADGIRSVQAALEADRHSTVRTLAEDVSMSKTTVHKVLKKDLKLSKIMPKFIPRILTDEQKKFRMRLCQLNLDALKEDDAYLQKFVTGDESWVSVYEVNGSSPHVNGTQLDPRTQGPRKPSGDVQPRRP